MRRSDKEVERERYNEFSRNVKKSGKINREFLRAINSTGMKQYIKPPYDFYKFLIESKANQRKLSHLDLCCGDGRHSFITAKLGANVMAIDYSVRSVEIAIQRAEELKIDVDFIEADVDNLDFLNRKFDLVTCVGSLSYLNHDIQIEQLKRLLNDDGCFIFLDSYNHNPVYKLNRFIHFLMGNRSFSTLQRMPSNDLINKFRQNFKEVNIHYFGIFTFVAPILDKFIGENNTAKIISFFDQISFLHRYAFKIVAEVKN